MRTAWPEVRLEEVADVRLGRQRSPKNHDGPEMRPYVRAANVGWRGLRLDDVKRMNFTDAEMVVYGLQPGDLLLNEASGSAREVGKPAIWSGEIGGCAFQNTLIRVRPTGADPRFLLHYFAGQASSGAFARKSRGVGIHHLGREALAAWLIPLPPIEEQRRIAALLDQADELRVKRQTSLALLDSLNESIFLDMFGDPATNPLGFPRAPLGVIATTTSGGTPDRSRADFYGEGIPWVKSGELREPVVSSTEETITEEGLRGSSAKLMPTGTVMLAMYGATAGAVAVLGIEAATNQAVCSISVGEQVSSVYLVRCLRLLTPSLLRQRVGGAQPNLSQGLVRALPVPVPPMASQDAFAEVLKKAHAVDDDLARSSVALEALFSSLQHRAFAGQL